MKFNKELIIDVLLHKEMENKKEEEEEGVV